MSRFHLFNIDVERDTGLIVRHTVAIDSQSFKRNEFEQMEELASGLGGYLHHYEPVEELVDTKVERMTPEDEECLILAQAPAEYTYWEKRVWRRGVVAVETLKEVQQAVRDSQDGKTVSTK